MPNSCRKFFYAAAFLLVWFTATTNLSASDGLRTVVLTGEAVRGAGPDTIFRGSLNRHAPALNNQGQVAFTGNIQGASTFGSFAVYSEGGGNGLRLLARNGTPAIEAGADAVFKNPDLFGGPVLSDQGHTAFVSSLTGTGIPTGTIGIWREDGNGNLALIAREGAPATGIASGVNYVTFFESLSSQSVGLLISDNGRIAFHGRLAGTGVNSSNNTGIWSEGGGSALELIARSGDPAPGVGNNFGNIDPARGPVMNRRGEVAFHANASGISGIWTQSQGNQLELVVKSEDPAPGPAGATFGGFAYHPGFNSRGHLSFTGGPSLWSNGHGNGFELIARIGSPAPGTPSGVTFSNTFTERVLNSRGESAFLGYLQGTGITFTNNTGLWSEGGGDGLKLVARAGDQAPGTESGVLFGPQIFENAPILNAQGQLAFLNSLQGPGVTILNNIGIWAEDVAGNLTLITRTGDLLNVSDDPLTPDLRTIRELSFAGRSGNDDGKRSGFNDRGQLAFWARFTDGSEGFFVSDIVAVPEPSSLLLAVLLICRLMTVRNKS